ncbi:MAG TPA: universal stress protein [Burkholderiales bacterium]
MKSALIATDFSSEAEAARRRVASIANETGLGGAIAHVLPGSLPAEMHAQSATQAQQALALLAGEMKRDGASFEPRLLSGDVAGELIRAAPEFDLVVAGARGQGVLLDFSIGRMSTRLVRGCARPVLIVKRPPDEPYRRVVAAVDCSEPSLVAATYGIQIAPKAEFNLVHAFEVEFEATLRRAGTTEDRIQRYRQEAREKAMAQMAAFAGRFALPSGKVWSSAVLGYPPKVIVDAVEQGNAQLVVLGKHAAGIVERLMVGSVALQVLEMAKCDVLVVPEPVA